MKIAVNDISFQKGFPDKYQAMEALEEFGKLCLFLDKEEVSGISPRHDIINSPEVNAALQLAPGYALINALRELAVRDREMFRFLIGKLTCCGADVEYGADEIIVEGIASKHCANFKENFFISLKSAEIFENESMTGILNGIKEITLRNIAEINHLYIYWKEVGFREYELNPKHGYREYIRSGGKSVGKAPATSELGQKLLNHAIEIRGHLYSVDEEDEGKIYEFRWSEANKYHGYHQDSLSTDMEQEVRKLWKNK